MTPDDLKQQLRTELRQKRVALEQRTERGHLIQQSVLALPQVQDAENLMVYVGSRSEVPTELLIETWLSEGKTLFVPWCQGHELRLFRLESMEELHPGAFEIPEPVTDLRNRPDRMGSSAELNLVILPGLGFDRKGGRLGQGRGYYDRLLQNASSEICLIGLAFDVQLVGDIPMKQHDVPLHLIVTESKIIRCQKESA